MIKKSIFLSLLILVFLIQIVKASEIISCTVSPQEATLKSQVKVEIQLNNSKNETVNDTVKINFPTAYLSCADTCSKVITMSPYSIGTASFVLQPIATTSEKQSITVVEPTSYTCPDILKITSGVTDTSPPTVGSITPTSVTSGQSTTFTTSVSDNIGVTACNFSYDNKSYPATVANNIASYTTSLSQGTYSVYFKCQDAAGNVGTGSATVTATKQQLSATLTLPKNTYYPADSFEPRATVKDPDGKIVVDATVSGNLTYGTKSESVRFFYSTLCDCYKLYYWFNEGTLPNDYTLTVTASHSSYQSGTATTSFKLIKPTLQMTMSTDKTEYNPGDTIKITVEVKDILGNAITNAYMRGEIKDATTGSLITAIYPRIKDSAYYYEYYVGSENVGKSYTINVNTSWKEQSAAASKTVSITKRGLNADIVLEKDVLMPGDVLKGKIKVFDKDGNIITDAKVGVEIKYLGSSTAAYQSGTPTSPTKAEYKIGSIKWLSATYKDGFYEIEQWKVEDWISPGTYTLSVKIDRVGESITIEKTIEITKEKLNVQVVVDQTSYAPGDRIYIKIYITYSNGSVVPNANIGGEIFPLIQEVANQTAGITGAAILVSPGATLTITGMALEPPRICRIYIYPTAPIYYKGEYYPRYYVDDTHIPSDCPIGKYVVRLRISAPGYAETEFTKEFDVALHKLLLETGFKIYSRPDTTQMNIYAEVKDDQGKRIPYANIKGYLYQFEKQVEGCIKTIYFNYNEFTNRYTSQTSLGKYECPAGEYLLQIIASQPSYETANVKETIKIDYSEGFEYNVVVPPAITTPVCKEVSCGPNCVNKICETPSPSEECYEEVTDKECMTNCISKATTAEREVINFDVEDCVKNCAKKVPCKGYAVTQPQSQDMLNKLEQIHTEIIKTGEQITVIERLLRAIVDFINSIVTAFGGGRVSPINTTV